MRTYEGTRTARVPIRLIYTQPDTGRLGLGPRERDLDLGPTERLGPAAAHTRGQFLRVIHRYCCNGCYPNGSRLAPAGLPRCKSAPGSSPGLPFRPQSDQPSGWNCAEPVPRLAVDCGDCSSVGGTDNLPRHLHTLVAARPGTCTHALIGMRAGLAMAAVIVAVTGYSMTRMVLPPEQGLAGTARGPQVTSLQGWPEGRQ